MNLTSVLVTAIGCLASLALEARASDPAAALAVAPQAPAPQPPSLEKPSFDRAVIEEVIEAVDDGYRFNAYIVRWHGSRVLVSDPIGAGHLEVGDTIRFLVGRHDVAGHRVLLFMSLERSANPQSPPVEPMEVAVASDTPATVEEVLNAEDGGYRFRAYLVRWRGKRVAVPDILLQTPHGVGEQLQVIAAHTSLAGRQLLTFMPVPAGTKDAPAANETRDTGVVEDVLRTKVDGDSYLAYVVQWQGSHVALPAEGALYQVGEPLSLVVSRVPLPKGGGILRLGSAAAVDSAAATDSALNVSTNATAATGVVDSVLSAQSGDYRYRAYLVTWHGTRIVVDDMFATTHYKAGDQLSFSVVHASDSGVRQVAFMLFDFPKASAAAAEKAAQ